MKERLEEQRDGQIDSSRRSIALGLLGALGGASLLKGCASTDGTNDQSMAGPNVDSVLQAQTGTNLRWFNKVFGTPPSDPGLADSIGTSANEVAILLGYAAPGDGGGGIFYWDSSTPLSPSDGGTVFGSQPQGRWKRLLERRFYRNARWFGAKGDGLTIDTTAIRAMFASTSAYAPGAEFHFPSGDYLVHETIKVSSTAPALSPAESFTIRGDHGSGQAFGTSLRWAGANDSDIMFQLSTADCLVEGMQFLVKAGHKCAALVNVGFSPNEPLQRINHHTFRYCAFAGNGPTKSHGNADYGVVLDYHNIAADQNQENTTFERCHFNNLVAACLWLQQQTQPYGIGLEYCHLGNTNMHSAENGPYGIGVRSDSPSVSLTVESCDMQRLACHFYMGAQPRSVVVRNCHAEQTKKILYGAFCCGNDLCTITLDGGRYTVGAYGAVAEGAEIVGAQVDWPASDTNVVDVRGDFPLTIRGVNFTSETYTPAPFKISVAANDLISAGNRYPNTNPFQRSIYLASNTKSGRTYSIGDQGSDPSGIGVSLRSLNGCENGGGTVTIANDSTSAVVTFANPEPQWPLPAAGVVPYRIALSVRERSSGATISTPYVSNITHGGFVINVPVAPGTPGSNQSVAISYELFR